MLFSVTAVKAQKCPYFAVYLALYNYTTNDSQAITAQNFACK